MDGTAHVGHRTPAKNITQFTTYPAERGTPARTFSRRVHWAVQACAPVHSIVFADRASVRREVGVMLCWWFSSSQRESLHKGLCRNYADQTADESLCTFCCKPKKCKITAVMIFLGIATKLKTWQCAAKIPSLSAGLLNSEAGSKRCHKLPRILPDCSQRKRLLLLCHPRDREGYWLLVTISFNFPEQQHVQYSSQCLVLFATRVDEICRAIAE